MNELEELALRRYLKLPIPKQLEEVGIHSPDKAFNTAQKHILDRLS